MTDTDRPAFARGLYALGETFNEPVSEMRAEAYFDALADLPIDAVLAAMRQAIQTGRFFPRPVEIREGIQGSTEDRAEMAWGATLSLVRRYGSWHCPQMCDWPDEATRRAAYELFGGWQRLCECLPGEGPGLHAAAKQFKATYRAYAARDQREALPAASVSGYLTEGE